MNMRKRKHLILFLGIVALASCQSVGQTDDVFTTQQRDAGSFSVRVTGHREKRSFGQVLGGANYVFEAKNISETDWKKFMVVVADDPEPIAEKNIGIAGEKIGYVFKNKKFAVTTDAAKNWSIWDVTQTPSLNSDRSCIIETVSISNNGQGKMELRCGTSSRMLSTTDFGVRWNE
jgi:hypothetical protein